MPKRKRKFNPNSTKDRFAYIARLTKDIPCPKIPACPMWLEGDACYCVSCTSKQLILMTAERTTKVPKQPELRYDCACPSRYHRKHCDHLKHSVPCPGTASNGRIDPTLTHFPCCRAYTLAHRKAKRS